jgi:hypothetical protein
MPSLAMEINFGDRLGGMLQSITHYVRLRTMRNVFI